MNLNFDKYQGTGNDFIMIDDREKRFPSQDIDLIKGLCDRRFGIGADGLILLQPHPDADFYMQYFNSDGRESSMCGNGGRCIVAFASSLKVIHHKTRFVAIDGMHEATIEGNQVALNMQDVRSIDVRTPDICIMNTGSPHFVQFLHEDVLDTDIVSMARNIRYSKEFEKEGINVNFANILGPQSIHMRTYERGVEDETLSCGTGVTAAAITHGLRQHFPSGNYDIHVQVLGGRLDVHYQLHADSRQATDVWLKGPADYVFSGEIGIH